MINQAEWRWYGTAGHFICAQYCRFHLCTIIGDYIISTVGEYFPPGGDGMEEIGCERFYETMVFKTGDLCVSKDCDCGQPLPANFAELELEGYNSKRAANEGHMRMCLKWATTQGANE